MDRRPREYWEEHRTDAEREDVRFLVSAGLTLEAACARVGVTVGAMEKRQARER